MPFFRRPDPAADADRAWLTPAQSRVGSTLDLLLDAPLFSATRAVQPEDLVGILRQAGAACRSGVPLAATCDLLAGARAGTPAGAFCGEVAEAVGRGATLAEALEPHAQAVGPVCLALVSAGEQAGDLPAALELAADALEEDLEGARLLRRAAASPLACAAVVGALIAVLAVVVTPVLTLGQAGTQLPGLTRALLDAARFAPLLAVPALVAGAALRTALRLRVTATAARRHLDGWLMRMPGFAELLRARAHGRLAGSLAWLLAVGVPVDQALRLAAATGNDVLDEAVVRAAELSAGGASLAEALAAEPLLAGSLAAVARSGQQTGALPELLRGHADQCRRRTRHLARSLAAVTELAASALTTVLLLGWLLGLFVPVLRASALVP